MHVDPRATPRGATWSGAARRGGAALALACAAASACGGNGNNEAAATSGGTGGHTSTTSTTSTGTGAPDAGTGGAAGGGGGVTGISGGVLDTLSFAIVGDTRPAMVDDTAAYPSAVIQKLWQQVEAVSPRPAFGLSTGDYMYANVPGTQAAPQMALYLAARQSFTNVVFPAMGNHECTGYTDSNCGPGPDGGPGNADGITPNYTQFMTKMLAPLGVTNPYYTVNVAAKNGAWTAKFVFVAANAWDAGQSAWFTGELAKPTTYTFVVRHEGTDANTAPGVTPSGAIMVDNPYTLLIAGHTHRFEYIEGSREVIVGNGGAPLTSSTAYYGYVIARQRASDGAIVFQSFDSTTNAVAQTFAVLANGTPTQ
jgi:Calcineurin-like phosphoesterase